MFLTHRPFSHYLEIVRTLLNAYMYMALGFTVVLAPTIFKIQNETMNC